MHLNTNTLFEIWNTCDFSSIFHDRFFLSLFFSYFSFFLSVDSLGVVMEVKVLLRRRIVHVSLFCSYGIQNYIRVLYDVETRRIIWWKWTRITESAIQPIGEYIVLAVGDDWMRHVYDKISSDPSERVLYVCEHHSIAIWQNVKALNFPLKNDETLFFSSLFFLLLPAVCTCVWCVCLYEKTPLLTMTMRSLMGK